MNYIEKTYNRFVHFLFPLIDRLYPFISLVLIVAAFSISGNYWQIRIVFLWFWFVNSEINRVGAMERDNLPIKPENSPFYHIYRFIDRIFFLFLLIFLVILLIPELLWLKSVFWGVFIIAVLLRTIGDRKYRPKRSEE